MLRTQGDGKASSIGPRSAVTDSAFERHCFEDAWIVDPDSSTFPNHDHLTHSFGCVLVSVVK